MDSHTQEEELPQNVYSFIINNAFSKHNTKALIRQNFTIFEFLFNEQRESVELMKKFEKAVFPMKRKWVQFTLAYKTHVLLKAEANKERKTIPQYVMDLIFNDLEERGYQVEREVKRKYERRHSEGIEV